jgi:predicted esterase
MPQRYTDSTYFKDTDLAVNNALVYGKAKDWHGATVKLDMDIIGPSLSCDSLKKRPLIVIFHGGGFQFRDNIRTHPLATLLAKRGFIVASVNYRLGVNAMGKWDITLFEATYRAVEDSKAALRFLVHNASKYGIDTSAIFIGGGSAGGMAAVYSAFYTQHDWDKYYPSFHKKLGNIDSSTNSLRDQYNLKGVLEMWGGIGDTSLITATAASHIAMLIFHGTADTVVPYKKPSDEYIRMVPVEGGYLIAQRYKHLNGLYQLNTVIKGGHAEGFDAKHLAEKISIFCKSLICHNFTSEEFSTTVDN